MPSADLAFERRTHLWLRWTVVMAAAAVILVLPRPAAVEPQGWHMLAIFVATVFGLILQPIPMGAMVILAITVSALTGTVTPRFAFESFGNPIIWLIVAAFLFARAVVHTRLGRRIAYLFIRGFGSSSLRLGYALAGADLVVSPVIPSDTARAGGIIFPIVRSLAEEYGSEPGPTSRVLGRYLMQCAYHVGCTTAAIFLTSMAANPLAVAFAQKYAGVTITWGEWALASSVPAAVSLALLPSLIYLLDPPEMKRTPQAQAVARDELARLGAMTSSEKKLIAILVAVLAGWATQRWHHVDAAVIALAGLVALLLTGIISWEHVLEEKRAWDAFLWFGGLIMMAEALSQYGVVQALGTWVSAHLQGWRWLPALAALVVVYTLAHYAFASMTAHITALYPAFLVIAVAHGAPPMMAALALAFFSSLNASLTHYGTGPAPIYFGAGYVPQATWWRVGSAVVAFQVVVWLGIGLLWWHVLKLW